MMSWFATISSPCSRRLPGSPRCFSSHEVYLVALIARSGVNESSFDGRATRGFLVPTTLGERTGTKVVRLDSNEREKRVVNTALYF